ncbi:hypothetical protein OBBRIDRAFT_653924 [Obba rivulosa]|uniref:Uncharacterized protein n=1 Tax=Obba rivulosa TaxID=1052685 RepID=A0A8E2DLB6_9APHY|nr:hypothetical protein OBBRIDRAFT_653924 [Obba rivulosa]
MPYYPDALWNRMLTLLEYRVEEAGRYAVSHVPRDGKWGSYSKTGANRTKTLRDAQDRVNYKIYTLGVARAVWLCDPEGKTRQRINIGVEPIRTSDLEAAKALLAHYSNPPKVYSDGDLIWANRRMVSYHHGTAHTVPFVDVYDGRVSFGSKTSMPKLSPLYISRNDVVLVEATLTRWKIGEESESSQDGQNAETSSRAARNMGWTSWKTGFELQSITLLFEGPEDIADDSESEADVGEI